MRAGAIAAGLLLAGCASVQAAEPTLAFPGAEGAGRFALGGRGGQVIRVTNLNDAGPGSLRAAVEAKGPRTVIFDTGGTIRLAKPLKISEGRITIAGQSAPGGGITLRDHALVIAADDVVVRYIRSRLGDESRIESDAVSINSGRRIILDHVSASWSVDETLSAGSRYEPPESGFYDVTVQWSVIAESLNRSGHAKGAHGYGTLLRGGHGARVSFHHNLWAHHRARMPRPGNYNGPDVDPTGPLVEFRSNVFYNWAGARAGYNADKAANITYAFIDNAYVRGPASEGALAFEESDSLAKAYFGGNSMDGAIPRDPWSLVTGVAAQRLPTAPDIAPVRPEPAMRAFERVLAQAGASRSRDAVDVRVVESVRARSGRLIDSQAEVGGWPVLDAGRPWVDRDGDGAPDDWERASGQNPDDASDGASDSDGDGYTNLEEWLASLAGR